MSDLTFESSLTMEEIEANFKDIDIFSGIVEGWKRLLHIQKEKYQQRHC